MRMATVLSCLFLAAASFGQDAIPKKGYVPDSATAVRIAEAVLIPGYGQDKIESQRPFTAKLKDDVWTVYGTVHSTQEQAPLQVFPYQCGVLEVRTSKTKDDVATVSATVPYCRQEQAPLQVFPYQCGVLEVRTSKTKYDVWTVSATVPYCRQEQAPLQVFPYQCGDLLQVRISKSDAHVLEMLPHK